MYKEYVLTLDRFELAVVRDALLGHKKIKAPNDPFCKVFKRFVNYFCDSVLSKVEKALLESNEPEKPLDKQ